MLARLVPVIAFVACTREPAAAPTQSEPPPIVAPVPAPVEAMPPPKEPPVVAQQEEPVDEEETPALDIEYVPTPDNVVKVMLDTAKVTKRDMVIDLGCGDGRLLVAAARRGARGYGVDLDPQRIREARANIEKAGVGHLVTVEQRNIFDVDLSPASVVTLYLLPSLNVKLIPQLEHLKKGARIVSHDFDMEGVEYDDVITVIAKHHRPPPELREHYVYLFSSPLKKTPPAKP